LLLLPLCTVHLLRLLLLRQQRLMLAPAAKQQASSSSDSRARRRSSRVQRKAQRLLVVQLALPAPALQLLQQDPGRWHRSLTPWVQELTAVLLSAAAALQAPVSKVANHLQQDQQEQQGQQGQQDLQHLPAQAVPACMASC
jgi:hypothetical protein